MTDKRDIAAKPLISQTSVSESLAPRLTTAAGKALDWIDDVLELAVDPENASLLRAQAAAAQTVLHTQVRVNALMMQEKRIDRALDTLIEIMRRQELKMSANRESDGCSPLMASLAPMQTM